ncbi:hypothetical protein [Acidicapsa acidisoli]|uniref:hypothetical protein n=1 Tax=Acidicapsa acidisoli TaxID=1615681 RepID=UPI0021DFABC4|nr:hypothetical protein [Acidicapsa acidisoli]
MGKHNKFIERPFVVLDFVDGHRWNQNNWDDSSAATERTIQAVIEKHTSVPIADVLVIEDLPSPNH